MTIKTFVRALSPRTVLLLTVDEQGSHPVVLSRAAAKKLGKELQMVARCLGVKINRRAKDARR